MKHIIRYIFVLLLLVLCSPTRTVIAQGLSDVDLIASSSADATRGANLVEASPSSIVKKVVEKTPDITEDKPEVKGKLEKYLEDNPVGPINGVNFMRHGILYAVSQGVPANTIVLILMFPLVATVVVIARHIIGLKSFGIFTPALLAVAFLTTGIIIGISLFVMILLVATFVRLLLKRVRIQYLPRMAVFMWFISMFIFGILLISPSIQQEELITIGIFPILILILSTESFLDLQITRNIEQAFKITGETLIVALAGYYLMNVEALQKFVLINPELFSLGILFVITIVESYSGLRLMELWRFRKIFR